MLDGFETLRIVRDGVALHVRRGGRGAPLLLLHGHPQTHAMWHGVAPALAGRFEVVLTDLRGYGDSGRPAPGEQSAAYAKREMALDARHVMRTLGHERFQVLAHDRGARVAHRLALDHPQAVERLLLLDIAPTLAMYERTTMAFAQAYYHWFHLIQPAPLPETHIGADPLFHLHAKLRAWGSGSLEIFEPEALAEYEAAFARPETIHATCEDYRASAGIDLQHDQADADAGRRLAQPLRVLWGEHGAVGRCFDVPALWRAAATDFTGRSLPCGHYIAEEAPGLLLDEAHSFLRSIP